MQIFIVQTLNSQSRNKYTDSEYLYNGGMKKTTKKKRGGQPKDNPASAKLGPFRVTPDKLQAYKNKAEEEEKSFSDWVRCALDRALKRK